MSSRYDRLSTEAKIRHHRSLAAFFGLGNNRAAMERQLRLAEGLERKAASK